MRIDVPAERAAVFGNDGRVFFDLDRLIAEYEAYIKKCETVSIGTNEDRQFIHGLRTVIFGIKRSKEILSLENMTGISLVDNPDD